MSSETERPKPIELSGQAARLPRVSFTATRAASTAEASSQDMIFGVDSPENLVKELSYRLSSLRSKPYGN